MPLARHLSICVLSLCATSASAQLRAGEWVSYRDAYRAMVVFEKYGGAKNYLQSQLQVAPQDRSVSFDGLQLTLAGKTNQVNLPLDPLGRAAFPLLKAAYDENVALLLSRKIGSFTVRPRVSIALQADGLYEDSELRAACEQALGFARYGDGSLRSRQCGGVRFVFAKRAGGGRRAPASPGRQRQRATRRVRHGLRRRWRRRLPDGALSFQRRGAGPVGHGQSTAGDRAGLRLKAPRTEGRRPVELLPDNFMEPQCAVSSCPCCYPPAR
ncbi:hypothetical protein [Massilia sp. Se16.2.3]|uniref:hypothetical protein n=1 Tax=Massilia sp. Se16.2.3 TaxID=2709303 RepID=UPI001E45CFAE|nr:hypothetical protein [Massilia sp. Se16.2.3]